MPTLRDVADYAGVSTATVSKVLSNKPYVSDTVRERVLEAVEVLQYTPNLAARALTGGRTHTIAAVFPYVFDPVFKDPFVMKILEGVEQVCADNRYNLLLSTPRVNNDTLDPTYQQLLLSGYAEGVIAIDNVPGVSFAAEAEKRGVAAVVLGHHNGETQVQSDNRSGGYQLMKAVLDCGHRAVGVISATESLNLAIKERLKGMAFAAAEGGLVFADLPIVNGDFSTVSGAAAIETLLAQAPDVSVVICLNDRMAMGAMQWLQNNGYTVPDDISVVGYDNIPLAEFCHPPLTTIDQQAVKLGEYAAKALFQKLNKEAPPNVVLPPQLIQRGSLAARQ